uniref:Eosinophil-associated ribonuclease 21 n=1 Tax=Mus caroli TaxID=10089 RepID=Q9JKG8_MUSCR|nr:eosinophil-associated ribonuclease 21 precursor [Mus caroli]
MGPKLLESRLCLLMMLGLVLMLASCLGQTPSQWVAIQHINNNANLQCNVEMQRINRFRRTCKGLNTFLHTTFADAVRVCHNPRKTCKDGTSPNCHDSSSKVSVTICKLTKWARNYSQCRYKTTGAEKSYTVACNPRTPRDSPTYPVVPVHLDGTF